MLEAEFSMCISRNRAKNISLGLTVIWLETHNISRRLPGSIAITPMLMGRIMLMWDNLCACAIVCVIDREKAEWRKMQAKGWNGTKLSFSWCFSCLNTPLVFLSLPLSIVLSPFYPFLFLFSCFSNFSYHIRWPGLSICPVGTDPDCSCQQRLSSPVMSKEPLSSKPASFTNSTFCPSLFSEPPFVCLGVCACLCVFSISVFFPIGWPSIQRHTCC